MTTSKVSSSVVVNRFTLVLIPLFFCAQRCAARCAATSTDPAERFPESPFVIRLRYDPSSTATLPCSLRTYETSAAGASSAIDDSGYDKYTILDIFKQDWEAFLAEDTSTSDQVVSKSALDTSLQVGDSISLVYWTDTGLRKDIPLYIKEDAEGFLAFLSPHRYCYSEEEPTVFPLPEVTSENLLSNPFLLSQCEQGNQGWSQLAPEATLFLESQTSALGVEASFVDASRNATNATTTTTTTNMTIDANATETDTNSSELTSSGLGNQIVEAEDANIPSGVAETSSARAAISSKILPLVISIIGVALAI